MKGLQYLLIYSGISGTRQLSVPIIPSNGYIQIFAIHFIPALHCLKN